jgi:protein tyrosine/serine phosphatase
MVRHFHIKAFYIVKPGVLYTSGQPRGMDYFRLLYRYHIATIVSVRPASEHREENWRSEEITWARDNGVRYIELPVEKGRWFPDQQTQDHFLAVMADKNNLPVLLHGGGNDKRVAALTAAWLKKNQGCTVEQAVKVAEEIIKGRKLSEPEKKFLRELAELI